MDRFEGHSHHRTGEEPLIVDEIGSDTHRGTRDIADPWYTGNFDATYEDVLAGCTGLLESLR